jgi:hypothetical protein
MPPTFQWIIAGYFETSDGARRGVRNQAGAGSTKDRQQAIASYRVLSEELLNRKKFMSRNCWPAILRAN